MKPIHFADRDVAIHYIFYFLLYNGNSWLLYITAIFDTMIFNWVEEEGREGAEKRREIAGGGGKQE